MIIERLIIENFRQFHGRQEIEFATGKKKNVTVIHAENGFGKTALLNALLWGFYGQDGLTEDLPKPEHILHDGLASSATDESEATATVEFTFRNGDEHFRVTRSLTLLQQADDPKKSKLELEIQTVEGQTLHSSGRDAQLKLNELMPEGISPFLFFNGERIDHFAMDRNSAKITDAIHQMLGLDILRRTIEDLQHGNVRGKLLKELKDHTDDETVKLIDQEQQLLAEITEVKQRLAACEANEAANEASLEAVKASLQANQVARELQSERMKLEAELKEVLKRLTELSQRLTVRIAEDGYTLFAETLVKSGEDIAKRLRAENKIPARVLNSFIDDLLKAKKCICGCELVEGSPPFEAVKKALTTAGDQNFNNAVGQLDNSIGVIKGAIANTRDALRQGITDRAELRQRRGSLEAQIEEISTKLGNKDDDKVQDLESKRIELAEKQKLLGREHGRFQSGVEEKTKQLQSVQQQIKDKKQKAEVAAKAQRRLNLVDETIETLERVLTFEREDLRQELGEEIERHFNKVKLKPDHYLELTPDFRLVLTKKMSGGKNGPVHLNVAHSTGERQVMSLVFIASLVALARRREELPTILKDVEGGSYPMVMDSPFGQLGDEFRAGISNWIPQLAPQVIILVSSSQYRGEVERELNQTGRVGKRFLLAYHAPTKRPEANETITIGGKRLKQYFQNDVEFTEIKEIEA
jgi:DNA sulfur modification protein DndD